MAASARAETPFPTDGTETLCERDKPGEATSCVGREYGFQSELQSKWPTIPEEFRAACVAEQASDFAVYYSKLAVCIANKYKAAKH